MSTWESEMTPEDWKRIMDVKDLTVTFTLEADMDAYAFLDHILLSDGRNWPDCLVGTRIVVDDIRLATSEEIEQMGYEEDNDN